MKKSTWRRTFTAEAIPKYPCPRCKEGHLVKEGEIREWQPAWSKIHQSGPDSDIMDHTERFHILMVCDVKTCGEFVSITGLSSPEPDWDDEHGKVLVNTFMPRSLYPAPRMIEVPANVPDAAKQELRNAEQVCWADTNSAANRLRVSVEFILDGLGIPREGMSNKGKPISYDLNGRIALLDKSAAAASGHASTFHALRTVGNLGSHGAGVTWENFLDGLLVYEKALTDLFGHEGRLFEEAKARLLSLKKPKQKKAPRSRSGAGGDGYRCAPPDQSSGSLG